MSKNAIKWPQMIAAVYSSFGSGDHSGDATTRRVMDKAVSWLVKGKELSPKLQTSVIQNINQRTKFVADINSAPIRLTADQIKYAKKTHPEWFGLQVVEEEDDYSPSIPRPFPAHSPSITLVFPDLYPPITLPFPDHSPTFPLEALLLAQQLVSEAIENCGSSPCGGSVSSRK